MYDDPEVREWGETPDAELSVAAFPSSQGQAERPRHTSRARRHEEKGDELDHASTIPAPSAPSFQRRSSSNHIRR